MSQRTISCEKEVSHDEAMLKKERKEWKKSMVHKKNCNSTCLEGPGFNPQSGHLFCLTQASKMKGIQFQSPSLFGVTKLVQVAYRGSGM